MYFNARSILNKIDLLRAECIVTRPDIIMVTESFGRSDITDAYLALDGYQLVVRKDGGDTEGGKCRGLLVYVLEGISAGELTIRGSSKTIECCGVKIPWGRGEDLKLVCVYRPPLAPRSVLDRGNTERLVEALRGIEGKVVICGDFNLPGVDWERNWSASEGETMVLNMLDDKFWHQTVRGPTHRDGNTLDLCITSSEELIANVEVTDPLGASDHHKIEVTMLGPAAHQGTTEEVPDWTKADYPAMKLALEGINWVEEFGDKSGLDCMDVFYEVVRRETDKCIPKKTRRTSSRPLWMSRNIISLIRKKRRLWRNYTTHEYYRQDFGSFQAYKEVEKKVKNEVKKAKRKFERKLAKQAKKNSKQFFSYLKKTTANRVSVGPLNGEDGMVTGDKEMAEMLNTHYCTVFTREGEERPEAEQLFRGEGGLEDMQFTESKVRKKLKDLKPSAAPGPDRVWTRVLHTMADVLAYPLAIIFGKLMEEVGVPEVWRKANVCPIFKKGSKGSPANYRPVSLTCVVGKVMESMIKDEVVAHPLVIYHHPM